MTATEIIMSKAQSIRWAHRNGQLRSIDNQLSCEEVWTNKPSIWFEQVFFQNDVVLIQIKAAQDATVVLTQYTEAGVGTGITATEVTWRPSFGSGETDEFGTYDYLVTLDTLGRFYFIATSEVSEWRSEWISVQEADNVNFRLLQWTNLDPDTSRYQFDYMTTSAIANVNFMRLLVDDFGYDTGGEKEVYDNQNEKSVIKANSWGIIQLKTGFIPRQIAQVIAIAMDHDCFLVNEQAYVVEKKPSIEGAGGWVQLSADMTLNLSLGLNTHDLGFDCDQVMGTSSVYNLVLTNVTGAQGVVVGNGYSINQIILELTSGTSVTCKIGTTVGGDEVMREYTITTANPFETFTRNFATLAGMTGTQQIYLTIAGGSLTVRIQTIKAIV